MDLTFTNAVYYPSWRVYRQQPPSALSLGHITHVFYAFAQYVTSISVLNGNSCAYISNSVRQDGTTYVSGFFRFGNNVSNAGEQHSDEYADLQIEVDGKLGCLAALVAQRAQFPHLKIILSIGGGGEGSANFAAVAASPTARMAFASCAKEFVERFEFNGIDSKSKSRVGEEHSTSYMRCTVDWEHPSDPEQGQNYNQLLVILRTYLPSPTYIITSALPAGEWALRHVNLAQAAAYLDFINLMAYDFSGPWTKFSGHHAQLHCPQIPGSDVTASCSSAVTYMLSKGVPSRKILLGVPTYGRSFLGATKAGQSFSGHGGEEGTFEYRDLPRPGTHEQIDEIAVAAFCIGSDGGFVTYDNPRTVQLKALFAKQHRLGGLFYWTGTADLQGPRSLIQAGHNSLLA